MNYVRIALAAIAAWVVSLGLDFLINTFGPFDVVRRVLRGSGECGAIDWTFLGFSIPEWTLACFIGLVIYAIYLSFQD